MKDSTTFNRDLSWLSFNYRVLQEAKDLSVPLYEKIKFLAIYSSNLDEFFRVRIASLRSLISLKEKTLKKLEFEPQQLLNQIIKIVNKQQEVFGDIFGNQIIPELQHNNIFLINENNLSDSQKEFIKEYDQQEILQHIQPLLLQRKRLKPFLRNNRLYLAVKLALKGSTKVTAPKRKIRHNYAILEIPSNHLPRFIQLPSEENKTCIIFLDDIIRFHLNEVFTGYDIETSYSVKLTRDAELYIDDEFSGNLLDKIQKSLKNRNIGAPSRFLYDLNMPKDFRKFLRDALQLSREDLVEGGRYHNFNDFFSFPNPGKNDLENKPMHPLNHSGIDKYPALFEAIDHEDFLLHFPYHKYDYVIRLLNDAGDDPDVVAIRLTQYRVAKQSEVVSSLIKAAQNGKDVMVFVELKARFDEKANIECAKEMKAAGIKVFYSMPGLKVHAKIALVKRKENGNYKNYCYLGTGNFNEKTAQLYSDIGLLTSDPDLTEEVEKVFEHLAGNRIEYKFKHILVAQFNMRKSFLKLIDNEISLAQKGEDAHMILKMNSIEDRKMISKLYEASQAGVKIDLIVRGICCVIPGIEDLSENIKVTSIIDRYLEHSRIFIFNNGGDVKIHAGSADWMKRNLSSRIEVAFPVRDEKLKVEIQKVISTQLKDNTKARLIDRLDKNKYKLKSEDEVKVQSQVATYEYLKHKNIL